MVDLMDYLMVAEKGWKRLVETFGLTEGQKPVPRKVDESSWFIFHRCRYRTSNFYNWGVHELLTLTTLFHFQVIETGKIVKHCKVEVYFIEFQLAENSQMDDKKMGKFSKGDTLGELGR
jgi:hypothetical protein